VESGFNEPDEKLRDLAEHLPGNIPLMA